MYLLLCRQLKMAQHFVTVCVVCVLCAAHAPCYAHSTFSPVGRQTGPGAKYSTGRPGYSEHSLPLRIGYTEVPQWKSFITKDSKRIENHKRSVNKVTGVEHENLHSPDRSLKDSGQVYILQESTQKEFADRSDQDNLELLKNSKNLKNVINVREKRSSQFDKKYFTKKVFELYGDGENMTMEGFEKLLEKMGLYQSGPRVSEQEIHSIDSNQSGSHLCKYNYF